MNRKKQSQEKELAGTPTALADCALSSEAQRTQVAKCSVKKGSRSTRKTAAGSSGRKARPVKQENELRPASKRSVLEASDTGIATIAVEGMTGTEVQSVESISDYPAELHDTESAMVASEWSLEFVESPAAVELVPAPEPLSPADEPTVGVVLAVEDESAPNPADAEARNELPPTESGRPRFLQVVIEVWKWALQKIKVRQVKKRLRVCESVSLGEKRFVAVIQVDDEQFLVGGSSSSVATLARLGSSEEFSSVLKSRWAEEPTRA